MRRNAVILSEPLTKPSRGQRSEHAISCSRCRESYFPTIRALLKGDYLCASCVNAYQKGRWEQIPEVRERRKKYQQKRRRPISLRKIPKRRFTIEDAQALMEDPFIGSLPGLPIRAVKQLRARLVREGLIPDSRATWSKEEIATLRAMYGKERIKRIAQALPGRSVKAIEVKAHKLRLEGKRALCVPKGARVRRADQLLIRDHVAAAVPRWPPPHIREEVISMLTLAVLERRVALEDVVGNVKPFITRAYAMHPDKGAPASLDAKIYDDGPTTLGDTIESTAFRF
jgi:hypothetical protein